MSAGRVFQESLRVLSGYELPDVASRDVLAVLEMARSGPHQFFFDAGCEAGLERKEILGRCVAIFFAYAAGQLADDLADDECTYLPDPSRTGPSAQYLLQTVFYACLTRSAIPKGAITLAADELVLGTGAQAVEVRTLTWNASLAREAAEGLAGRQLAAFLSLLWAETSLANRALAVGFPLGVAAHIATDIETEDPRFWALPDEDRAEVLSWASHAAKGVRASGLRSVLPVLAFVDPALALAA